MSPDRIRQLLDTTPFEPFTVFTGDGSTVDVLSREFVWLKPGGRTLIVSVPKIANAKEEGEFEDHNIDDIPDNEGNDARETERPEWSETRQLKNRRLLD